MTGLNVENCPERTPEMIEKGQVWVWIWDRVHREPVIINGRWQFESASKEPESGHWEIRGTGARLANRDPRR